MICLFGFSIFFLSFFFSDPPTTEIYTLSLHDALPILNVGERHHARAEGHATAPSGQAGSSVGLSRTRRGLHRDRKSTRLNSSHLGISYAVFCLKKKIQKRLKTKCIKRRTTL